MHPDRAMDSRGGLFQRFIEARRWRRRPPCREASLARTVDPLIVESLEQRRLLASVSFSSGVWTLNADGTAETIYVYRVIETSPATDKIKLQIGTTIWSRDSADITVKVQVLANGGDDIVHVETDQEVADNLTVLGLNAKGNDGVHKNVEVQGGAGNDTVYAGDMADTVYGGSGADYIATRNGNDSAYGNSGDDDLWGGAGNDVLWGDDSDGEETGADEVFGEAGNDHCYGGGGDDWVQGGIGDDWMWGDDPAIGTVTGYDSLDGRDGGIDFFRGGPGDDQVWARDGEGNDNIDGGAGTDTLWNYDSGDTFTGMEVY